MGERSKILKELYYKKGHTSILGLWRASKDVGLKVSQIYIKKWLDNQKSYQRHKKPVKQKKFNKIMAYHINDLFQIDLLYMANMIRGGSKRKRTLVDLPQHNKGYKYIMTVIDVFSKKAYAYKLKTHRSRDTIAVFKQLLNDIAPQKPERVSMDDGSEFMSHFKSFLDENNIKHMTSRAGNKNRMGVIERFNRTLRERLFKFMTMNSTKIWIDHLDTVVDQYNNTYHSVVKKKPEDVTLTDEIKIYTDVFAEGKKAIKSDLVVGDLVRIKIDKNIFDKGSSVNYSRTVYKIKEINTNGSIRLHKKKKTFLPRDLLKVKKPRKNPFKKPKGPTKSLKRKMKDVRKKTVAKPFESRVTERPKRVRKPAYKIFQDGVYRG